MIPAGQDVSHAALAPLTPARGCRYPLGIQRGRDLGQRVARRAQLRGPAGGLVASSGGKAEAIRDQVVYRHGLFTDLPEIAQSMYAAAARHDGIDFDPADFGEFTA